MDFFAKQDSARKQTTILLVYFALAILGTSALVYVALLFAFELCMAYAEAKGTVDNWDPKWWYPNFFIGTFLTTLTVVAIGSLIKKSELAGGGPLIASQMGGRPILPDAEDFYERRLRNVVEEMAIASGVPVPQVYVLERERGINAFAAGFRMGDAVIAVTYGSMVGLSRDELQGVIAHEFSHILNGDMRMNLELIGWLYGLTAITGAGRGILKGLEYSRGRGGLALAAVGGSLYAVGAIGTGFAGMVKSMISKQREYLADASAVQFTRNPTGLAGALKKIGGLVHDGSRLRSWRADQISHMCFGSSLRGTMFSTHPPLEKRIQWLEPGFKGKFQNITLDSVYEDLHASEGAPRPSALTGSSTGDVFGFPVKGHANKSFNQPSSSTYAEKSAAGFAALNSFDNKPISGHRLLESVGKPLEQQEETAKALIASIPERVKEYASSPYGARMLIYFLLLDSRPEIIDKQMKLIAEMAETEVFQTLEKALPNIGKIDPALRLPIIDLTIPALRFLSTGQYVTFMAVVDALAAADNEISVSEFALQRILHHHLDPLFKGKNRTRPANYSNIRGLVNETSTLLSVLARNCHGFGVEASSAFLAAIELIEDPRTQFNMIDAEQCTWDELEKALNKLNEGSGQVKKQILAAIIACMMHDKEITVDEVELFRAIAVTLDCPVPPWITPVKLEDMA